METLAYESGSLEVVVLPTFGARLHRLRAFGHDLLRTPDDPGLHLSDPFFWGAYVMAPWCNRLEAGPVRVGSRVVELRSNFADGSAIHGQVYSRPWQVREDGALVIRGWGGRWPWPYEVKQQLRVSGAELRIELTLQNLGDDRMPAGLGLHPWFRKPLRLAIRARSVFPDNRKIDVEPEPVAGRLDLRALTDMTQAVDATWTDLSTPAVELVWPEGVRATMRIEPPGAFVAAASPTDLDAVAAEPTTHAPQGLRRLLNDQPGPLSWLAPDDTLSLAVRLTFEQTGG